LTPFVKLSIGLLGSGPPERPLRIRGTHGVAVLLLGLLVLAATVGVPVWHSARSMPTGWLLGPQTDTFAFISPSILNIVMPLLAIRSFLQPLNLRRHRVRLVPVWLGGRRENTRRAAIIALTFANATHSFYSFLYPPRLDTARDYRGVTYFIRSLDHDVAEDFNSLIFTPAHHGVWRLEPWRALRSGDLSFHRALTGMLLILIMAFSLR
jgi:hypothetical protein